MTLTIVAIMIVCALFGSIPLVSALTVSDFNRAGYSTAFVTTGSTYFTDRTTTLPAEPVFEYRDLLWIRTPNNDKSGTGDAFLSFTVDEPVTVYVAFDQRANIPSWLTTWERRPHPLQLEHTTHIYAKAFSAGSITIGGSNTGNNNYVLLLSTTPLPTYSTPIATSWPTPDSYDYLLLDTRLGGAQDIQRAINLSDALRFSGLGASESCDSGNCLDVNWTLDINDGNRGFVWSIIKDAGNPAGCVQGGPSQQNWKVEKSLSGHGANGKTVYFQHKVWAGRTATGSGVGDIGSFQHGGKKFIWFRSPETGGRFTGAGGTSSGEHSAVFDPVTGQTGTGTPNDPRSTDGIFYSADFAPENGVDLSWNSYNNQPLTVTYAFTTESSPGADDGAFRWWVDDTLVMNVSNFAIGTLGWGWAQLGGPTWICPPQNQTAYYWDIIVWEDAPPVIPITPTPPPIIRRVGDLNNDGVVDIADVILIIANFKRRNSYDDGTDINADGTVNIFDMVLLGKNWGGSSATPAFAFASDFSTGTGTDSAIVRDTAKRIPWAQLSGGSSGPNASEVLPAAAVDFPSQNALLIRATNFNGGGASSRILRINNTIPIPAIGESLYYRWYFRLVNPDTTTTGTAHPIQDGWAAGSLNWNFQARAPDNSNTWSIRWGIANTAWPNNGWRVDNLEKHKTYRVEMRLHRVGETTYMIHPRVYDTAGNLLYDNNDFRNTFGTNGNMSLAENPVFTFFNVNELGGLNAGSNGAMQGTVAEDYPFDFSWQGAFCVRTDDWCGPYQVGEGP